MTDPRPHPHFDDRGTLDWHTSLKGALEAAAAAHLRECVGCVDHFLEPAKSRYALIVDEGAISAQD